MKVSTIALVICWFSLGFVSGKRTTRYLLNKPQCTDEAQLKLERVIAKLATVGPNGRKFPESLDQIKPFCRDTNRMIVQIETFLKDCYEKSVRDYANVLIYTLKKNVRKYCVKGNKLVARVLKLAPCANKYVQPYDDCAQEYIAKTRQLIQLKDDTHKIHYACCFFVEGIKCAEEFLDKIPCIQPHLPTMMEQFRIGSGSITEIMCGDYNESTDACQKLGPPPKPKKENKKYYATPVSLLIDLLESFQNFTAPFPSK